MSFVPHTFGCRVRLNQFWVQLNRPDVILSTPEWLWRFACVNARLPGVGVVMDPRFDLYSYRRVYFYGRVVFFSCYRLGSRLTAAAGVMRCNGPFL